MKFRTKILLHATFWILFEFFNFIIYTLPFFKESTGLKLFIATTIVSLVSGIIYFYTHYLFLLPLITQKKYVRYSILLLITTFIFFTLKGYAWHDFTFVKWILSNNHQVAGFIHITLHLLFISAAIYIHESWMNSETIKKQLEQEIKATELLYLKSQINPHFLFNTMNNIYGLALMKNPNTAIVIRQLKDMMLYNDNFTKHKKISIAEELKYLQSYINLFKLRSSVLDIKFEYSISSDTIEIEPMILLPFLENAFKHGAIDKTAFINIYLTANQNNIYFKIINPISLNKRKDSTSGIGIKNVQRRLELIYNQRHQFSSTIIDNNFIVELKLTSI